MKLLLAVMTSWLFCAVAVAQELPFNLVFGDFTQGSVVSVDQVHGQHVMVNDHLLIEDAAGRSVFGIGRDVTQLTIRWQDAQGQSQQIQQVVKRRDYDVQHINGLPNNKVNPNPQEVAEILANNRLIAQTRLHASRTLSPVLPFMWPVSGRISGVYGSQRILNSQPRRPHFGVDIAAPEGTPVYAPARAKVVLVHPHMVLTGKTMMLDHGLGLTSIYVHLSEIAVKEGDWVAQGQLIGKVGKTGRATGPHLHWGISWMDVQVDAAKLVATPVPPSLIP